MSKIAMKTPLVEMDGDEMTRVLWGWVKDKLIHPYVDLKTEYFDLGLEHRDKTDDKVTLDVLAGYEGNLNAVNGQCLAAALPLPASAHTLPLKFPSAASTNK